MTRQRNLDRRNQVSGAEGLHDVGHRAGVTSTLDEFRLRERRQHDDGAGQLLQDLLRCGDAVHLRHLDIHHAQIGFELECQLDSFLTVGSFADDLEPRLGQRLNDIETNQPLVFCDEDATRFSLLFTHCHIPQFDRFAQLLYCGSRTRESPDSPTGRGGRLKPGLLWVRIPLGVPPMEYVLLMVPAIQRVCDVRSTN